MTKVTSVNVCNQKLALKMYEYADLTIDTINTTSEGEKAIVDVMAQRRKFEYLNAKLGILKEARNNKNLKIFGDNTDDVMTQVAAFNSSGL
jgi:plastocyanin domain-containing protein